MDVINLLFRRALLLLLLRAALTVVVAMAVAMMVVVVVVVVVARVSVVVLLVGSLCGRGPLSLARDGRVPLTLSVGGGDHEGRCVDLGLRHLAAFFLAFAGGSRGVVVLWWCEVRVLFFPPQSLL